MIGSRFNHHTTSATLGFPSVRISDPAPLNSSARSLGFTESHLTPKCLRRQHPHLGSPPSRARPARLLRGIALLCAEPHTLHGPSRSVGCHRRATPLVPPADILARPLGGRIASQAGLQDNLSKKRRPRPKATAVTPPAMPAAANAAAAATTAQGAVAGSSRRGSRAAAKRSVPIIENLEDEDGESDFEQ